MTDETIGAGGDEPYTMLGFAQSMALQWGKVDLLVIGPDCDLERAGELAAYFASFAGESGERVAEAVWVFLPPTAPGGAGEALMLLRRAFAATLGDLSDGQATDAHIEGGFHFISPRIVPSYGGDELVALIATAPARTAILVVDAHRFRLAATTGADGDQLEENAWVAHLHQFLVEVDALVGKNGVYVALDGGAFAPTRQVNLDLLRSVGDTGLVSSGPQNTCSDDIVAKVSRWIDGAKAGEIGRVFEEIDADKTMDERQRFYLKLDAYSAADMHEQVREWMGKNAPMLVDLPPDQALHIARVAEAADDDDYAESLIATALPLIRSERDFENALVTALRLRGRSIGGDVRTAFAALFPKSSVLRRLAVVEAAREGDYARAAEMTMAFADPEAAGRLRFYEMMAHATAHQGWNPADARAEIASALPDLADDASLEIVRALDRSDRRNDIMPFLIERGADISRLELLRLLRQAGTMLQAGQLPPDDPVIETIADRALSFLAAHPADGLVRTRLTTLMGPHMTAGRGLATLILLTLQRAQRVPAIRERPKIDDRPQPTFPDELMPRLDKIWRWIGERGHGMWLVGKHALPFEQLDLPPEEVLAGILLGVDHIGDRLSDEGDLALLRLYMAVAHAIAPLSPEPDEDLTVLRTVGGKLVLAGKGQTARDLAEFAVTIAGDRPTRQRQALFAFADIYARLGMKTEALVALAATYDVAAEVTWDQVWFETNLLFRLLRDVGMSELALPLLERSRFALQALGIAERDGYRLETLELQARVSLFDVNGGSDTDLVGLLEDAQANAEDVLARAEDVVPIAMILNSLIGLARGRALNASAPAEDILERITATLPLPQQQMIRAAGPAPALADIAAVAGAIDEARYVDDTGYDLRHLRIMTRRLVGQAIDAVEPTTLAYAVEASADHGISVKATNGDKVAVERLLARGDGPSEAAEALSKLGPTIVGLALFGQQLATVEFAEGKATDLTLELTKTFSLAALQKWSERFPKDYSLEEKDLDRDQVRGSVVDLGLTKLPKRSVLIADAQLQRFPPTLLTIDGNFAGFDHAIGVTPSLEWLTASRSLNRQGDGSARMWIPVSATGGDNATLKLMADEVAPTLASQGVPLERGARPSADFARADVAIIGAHGGLAEVNRYFRSLSDDDHTVTELSEVAEMTRRARLTILFVCSGGRIDPHPETGMAIGLSKQILARGSAAVIAPAWPVPFFMAPPWLEGFLAAWRSGAVLLDACYAANAHVGNKTSWDPKRTLAMQLYGDPYLTAV